MSEAGSSLPARGNSRNFSTNVVPLFPGETINNQQPAKKEKGGSEPSWTRSLLGQVKDLPCVQLDVIHESLFSISTHITGIANSPRSVKETWAVMIKVDGTVLSLARILVMIAFHRKPEDRREQEARARMICRHSLINTRLNADLIADAARSLMTEDGAVA